MPRLGTHTQHGYVAISSRCSAPSFSKSNSDMSGGRALGVVQNAQQQWHDPFSRGCCCQERRQQQQNTWHDMSATASDRLAFAMSSSSCRKSSQPRPDVLGGPAGNRQQQWTQTAHQTGFGPAAPCSTARGNLSCQRLLLTSIYSKTETQTPTLRIANRSAAQGCC